MTELAIPEVLLDPRSGELIPAAEVSRVAEALGAWRELRRQVSEAMAHATAILVAESERQGTKTLRYGATEVTISAGSELVWDVDMLVSQLVDAGLPSERIADLVKTTVEEKVDARVAKQLEASNPVYAEIIDRARRRVDKPRYARVKGAA